jgi:hypothetical protein
MKWNQEILWYNNKTLKVRTFKLGLSETKCIKSYNLWHDSVVSLILCSQKRYQNDLWRTIIYNTTSFTVNLSDQPIHFC